MNYANTCGDSKNYRKSCPGLSQTIAKPELGHIFKSTTIDFLAQLYSLENTPHVRINFSQIFLPEQRQLGLFT